MRIPLRVESASVRDETRAIRGRELVALYRLALVGAAVNHSMLGTIVLVGMI